MNNDKNKKMPPNQPPMQKGKGGHPGMPAGKKMKRGAKNAGKTFARLFGYLIKGYAFRLILVLACIGLSAVASLYAARFLEKLIAEITLLSDAVKGGLPVGELNYDPIVYEIVKMIIVYVLGILSSFLFNFMMVKVSQGVLKTVREDLFAKMQRLPISYFDRNEFGNIMSRYTNDTDAIEQLISQSIPNSVSSIVTIITSFIMMVTTSWQLTLVVLCTLVLMMVVIKFVGGNSAKYFIAQQMSVGKLNGYIEEMSNGQKVVKVFNHEDEAKADFDKLNGELCENMTKAHTFANIFMPIMANLNYLQYVIVAMVGGVLALKGLLIVPEGSVALGIVASFLLLSRNFSRPITMVSQQINSIVMALAGAERVFELMDEKPETDEGYVTLVNARLGEKGEIIPCDEHTGTWAWYNPQAKEGEPKYILLRGDITLEKVDFEYIPGKQVLNDITVYARPGQKIALVGATGAGKTTIANLINRFYDIADGKVRYDGININKIKKADLRRSLGVVLQDVNLFTGTIAENIRYGRMDASDEDVIDAAKLANAHDFISRLPEGYDTMLTGDGANLSQGQRQLLSIARAAIADSPVMILDEATSSIDTRTEFLVQRGMDKLMEGRTVFVIAHRLSTIRNADVIMVMEHGEIIERGNHEDLIAKKGKYYQLYTGMFELD